jgi:hypothetical protein
MSRATVAGLLAVAAGVTLQACASAPSIITLSVDTPPELTTTPVIVITGRVDRDGDAAVPVVVEVLGGVATAADTLDGPGSFAVTVSLVLNATSTLQVTAQDDRGETSATLQFTVVHDGTGPTVVSASPTGDLVSTSVVVEVVFDEPVLETALNAGLRLVRNGRQVPGTSVPVDSVTYQFIPAAALPENGVFEVAFEGLTDLAGNAAEPAPQACFVTVPPGNTTVLADGVDDFFLAGFAIGASPSDMREFRFARQGDSLTGVLVFTLPRSYDSTATENIMALIELDLDQDSTTGVITLKDSLFKTSGQPDSLLTGMGAEFVIGVEPYTLSDSAYVGRYVRPLEFDVTHTFLPSVCEEYVGFVVPSDAFDPDDGVVNAVFTTFNFEGLSFTLDPTPTGGHWTADLGLLPAAQRVAAPPTLRRARMQIPLHPLRERRD